MKRIVLALAVLGLVTAAYSADTVVEEIIARINNSIITRSDLQRSREQSLQELREKGMSVAEAEQQAAQHEKDVLRDLIDQQLLVQKASDLGITGDTELIKRLDEIRKSMNLDSMEALEKAAQAQGVSYEDFKQNLKNQILTQQVIGRDVGSRIQNTQEEIKQFYDAHKSEMERPERVALSEILVSTQKPGPDGKLADVEDPAQITAAEKKAQGLLDSINKGAKFDDVAKSNSDGPTAAQGGDLGYFNRGTLAKELEDLTFAMKPGEVSKVIRTKQGFVLLEVTAHDAPGVPPLKDVEGAIQEQLYLQKLQPALRAYLTKLREEAYIDIKSGFVDTGASPNQTKPVITTADAEAGKGKLKKKKHFILF